MSCFIYSPIEVPDETFEGAEYDLEINKHLTPLRVLNSTLQGAKLLVCTLRVISLSRKILTYAYKDFAYIEMTVQS